jgi:hypothetical protein
MTVPGVYSSGGCELGAPHPVPNGFALKKPRCCRGFFASRAGLSSPDLRCMVGVAAQRWRRRSLFAGHVPVDEPLRRLNGINFCLAGTLAGFGSYVAVYLTDQKWPLRRLAEHGDERN